MKRFLLLLITILPSFLLAQGHIYQHMQEEIAAGATFESIDVVQLINKSATDFDVDPTLVSRSVVSQIDMDAMRYLQVNKPAFFKMQMPFPDGTMRTILLQENKILSPSFALIDSKTNLPIPYTGPLHYKGIIQGDRHSVVAMTFDFEEIMGLVSNNEGNVVLGKIGGQDDAHLIYFDKEFLAANPLDCGTENDDYVYTKQEINFEATDKDVGDCVGIYIEIDNDIVSQKGGSTQATNYITGLFNQSFVLYENDQLELYISEIKVWTTTSPYSSSSSSGMLSDFQGSTGSFNGDLAHLVSYQASGGIAAGFSGICASNPDNSKCFSSINSTYSNVPSYSFSVMVVTHEMGHLIGSRHTHACVWNGNGTAIDGCAGGTEGSCSLPGNPSGGGTIMSYCHITNVGINFNLGFGTQPGNVVRGTVANASCLNPCGSGPTCSDGIQNGQETGVDCGGPDCPPCSGSYCTSNGQNTNYEFIQSVSIGSFSNSSGNNSGYGNFTSQTITLDEGSSNSVSLTPGFAGSAYSENWSVWADLNGDLDFTDSGELLFQGAGNSVVSGTINIPSSVAVSSTRLRVAMKYGGYATPCEIFTYGEVEDYTLNIQSAATCTDGIQNGQETGVDCGGPDCPPCNVNYCNSSGNNSSYEWIQRITLGSINNTSGNNGGYADFTSQSTNLSTTSGTTMTLYPGFSGSTYTEYWRIWVDLNHDGDFSDAGELRLSGSGTGNLSGTLTIPSSATPGATRMRVSMKWNAVPSPCETFSYGEVEDYTVNILSSTIDNDEQIAAVEPLALNMDSPVHYTEQHALQVYPNPANELIFIEFNQIEDVESDLRIVDMYGKMVFTKKIAPNSKSDTHQLNVSDFNAGVYYAVVNQDGRQIIQKFVIIN